MPFLMRLLEIKKLFAYFMPACPRHYIEKLIP